MALFERLFDSSRRPALEHIEELDQQIDAALRQAGARLLNELQAFVHELLLDLLSFANDSLALKGGVQCYQKRLHLFENERVLYLLENFPEGSLALILKIQDDESLIHIA